MNHEKYKDHTAEYAIAEELKEGMLFRSYKPVMLLVTGKSSPKR